MKITAEKTTRPYPKGTKTRVKNTAAARTLLSQNNKKRERKKEKIKKKRFRLEFSFQM